VYFFIGEEDEIIVVNAEIKAEQTPSQTQTLEATPR
jgi:hypothetical protein